MSELLKLYSKFLSVCEGEDCSDDEDDDNDDDDHMTRNLRVEIFMNTQGYWNITLSYFCSTRNLEEIRVLS
jgi:hypothetical protein